MTCLEQSQSCSIWYIVLRCCSLHLNKNKSTNFLIVKCTSNLCFTSFFLKNISIIMFQINMVVFFLPFVLSNFLWNVYFKNPLFSVLWEMFSFYWSSTNSSFDSSPLNQCGCWVGLHHPHQEEYPTVHCLDVGVVLLEEFLVISLPF